MPYFEFDIENAQCLYLDTDGGTDIRVSIDGEKETLYTGCVGMVNIGNDKINTKKHTVRVYCGDEKRFHPQGSLFRLLLCYQQDKIG